MKLIREWLAGEKHITDYIEHIYELDTEVLVGYHVNTRYSVRVLYSTRGGCYCERVTNRGGNTKYWILYSRPLADVRAREFFVRILSWT